MEFAELRHIFTVENEIGRGSFGIVYRGTRDSTSYAIKRVFCTIEPSLIKKEILFSKLLQGHSPYICCVVDGYRKGQQISLVMPYVRHQNFKEFFTQFTMSQIQIYMTKLLTSLACLQNHGVIHKDLKPQNFLFDPETYNCALIDFGLAELDETKQPNIPGDRRKYFNELLRENVQHVRRGTRGYLAPECILEVEACTTAVDIWAAGVIFLTLLTKRYPFFQLNKRHKYDYRIQALLQYADFFGSKKMEEAATYYSRGVTLPPNISKAGFDLQGFFPQISENAKDLLYKMMNMKFTERITAEEALQHPFINKRETH